jgi:hypothetical protein
MRFIPWQFKKIQTAQVAAIGLALAWSWLLTPAAFGDDPEIVVRLASGREVRGHMDTASSTQHLVMENTRGGITLRRPIEWQRIDRVTADGQPITVMQLHEMASKRARQQVASRGRTVPTKTIQLRSALPAAAPLSDAGSTAPKVATVAMDPQIGNWDGDVEVDGLIVDVAPLDLDRNIIPTNATVEVEMFAPQRRSFDLAPQSGGDTLELVERWTRAITPADFGASGARLRLPFGAVHPDLRLDWTASTYGLVHIRLVVPGHGVFEDSRDGVRIRPWAPNRDRLEMKTGQQFLPTENLGRRD